MTASEREARRRAGWQGRTSGDRPDDDYWPDDTGPADDYAPEGQYVTYGPRPARARAAAGELATFPAWSRGPVRRAAVPTRLPAVTAAGAELGTAATDAGAAGPVSRTRGPGGPGAELGAGRRRAGSRAGTASAGGSAAATPARPYGRILIFTLLEDRVADFDRLAEQTAEEVRTGEPDTLVYVIHLVPNAPLQRIFYEIYRDRAAFDSHESQPYMQRFVAERRSCVLATNVIELRLKYAKVAPLPSPQAPLRAPAAAGRARRRAGAVAGRPAAPQPPPSGPPAAARGSRGPGASGSPEASAPAPGPAAAPRPAA